MRERDIEIHLLHEVKKRGGICWKFASPGTAGVPDRVVVLNRETWFVELKAPGKKPTALQERRMGQLRQAGANVTWLDSREAVDEFIKEHFGG